MSKQFRNMVQWLMPFRKWSWLVILIMVFCISLVWSWAQQLKPPPITRVDNVKELIHGVEIVDPYRWLEDQESPETRAWIDAQNEYSHSLIDSLPTRQRISQRLTELMKVDKISIPRVRNGRYFLRKRAANQEQWIIYVREGLEGKDEVLIDPHPMSPDHTTSVSLLDVSKDGTTMAYGIRQGGEDEIAVNLFDVDRRLDLPDRLPKARYFGVSIKPDNSGFYYTRHGANGGRIYYHAMGTNPTSDVEIFGKGYGPDKILFASVSEDGHYLIIHVLHGSAAQKTEIYYQDLVNKTPAVPIIKDIDATFFGEIADDKLFVQTNWKAPNGRILIVNLDNPARENWQEI